jgi:hypothetical protein
MKSKNGFFTMMRNMLCVIVLILPLAGCKLFKSPDYELLVTVGEGVKGTPAAGAQALADLTAVTYVYAPVNSLHTVEVILNGQQTAASGTVTMYNDLTLVARLIDVRASWNVAFVDASSKSSTFTITFSGTDILSGTFSDSQGHVGTWDAASNVIHLSYGNWESYTFTGTLFSMSGTWTNGGATGTWSATRK